MDSVEFSFGSNPTQSYTRSSPFFFFLFPYSLILPSLPLFAIFFLNIIRTTQAHFSSSLVPHISDIYISQCPTHHGGASDCHAQPEPALAGGTCGVTFERDGLAGCDGGVAGGVFRRGGDLGRERLVGGSRFPGGEI